MKQTEKNTGFLNKDSALEDALLVRQHIKSGLFKKYKGGTAEVVKGRKLKTYLGSIHRWDVLITY